MTFWRLVFSDNRIPSTADPDAITASLLGPLFYRRWFSREPIATTTFVEMVVDSSVAPYANALQQFRVNAVDPGYSATDLNGHRGTQTVEQGAEVIVQMAAIGSDGPTGGFVDRRGPVPW